MKKIFSLLLVMMFGLGLFACKKKEEPKPINVVLPQGVPALALGQLFSDKNVNFKIVNGPEPLKAELVKGESDVVVASIMMGAQLNALGKSGYKLAAVISKNNFYLVGKKGTTLTDIKSVEGKKIGAFGENNIPDAVLKEVLKANSVNVKEITYSISAANVLTEKLLSPSNDSDFVLSSEPFISQVEKKSGQTFSRLDVAKLFDSGNTEVYQAGIFVKEKTKEVNDFLAKLKEAIAKIKTDAKAVSKNLMALDKEKYPFFSKLGEDIIEKTLASGAIDFLEAKPNETKLVKFFTFLKEQKIINQEITNKQFI